ncbi:MAG: nucleotide exchange factor GrpE [Burkholderiales bacterium]
MGVEHSNIPEPAAESAATTTGEPVEAMPSVEELLKRAELASQEHHDAWLRARADAENIRKRAQLELASAHKFAIEGFASELLAVKDALEAALTVQSSSIDDLHSGVSLTIKQLISAFEKFNIVEINPMNEKFDPRRHHAMGTAESDAPTNTVLEVMQKGYSLHERILRPALVRVSKAKTG